MNISSVLWTMSQIDGAHLETLVGLISSSVKDIIAECTALNRPITSIDKPDQCVVDEVTRSAAIKRAVKIVSSACSQLCASIAPASETVTNVRKLRRSALC